jgi:uncharacterized membrane protein (UPF0127 family)
MPGGDVAADNVEYAQSLWTKGVGLIGRRSLSKSEGLWLPKVDSIHTFGMAFPIDVLFLDEHYRTTLAIRSVRPCRICLSPKGTVHCIELAAGTLTKDQCIPNSAQWRLEPAI